MIKLNIRRQTFLHREAGDTWIKKKSFIECISALSAFFILTCIWKKFRISLSPTSAVFHSRLHNFALCDNGFYTFGSERLNGDSVLHILYYHVEFIKDILPAMAKVGA